MSTLQQALDRMAIQASGIARDANMSPIVDSDVTAYMVWPHAIRSAVYTVIRRGDDLQDLMQSHTIAITAGVGPLPATLIREAIDRAIFVDRPYVTAFSYAEFQQFAYPVSTLNLYPSMPLGGNYFALLGSQMYFRDADTFGSEFTGNITVIAPTLDALPSDPEAEMEIPDRLIESAIMLGATVLRGEVPLSQLVETYLKIFRQPKSMEMGLWDD